jgi:hypothetical protein
MPILIRAIGIEGTWVPFEKVRNASPQSGGKLLQKHGKTVVFEPAIFRGFRDGTDKLIPLRVFLQYRLL